MADYKHADRTFDDVLNDLMDKVPVEDIMAEQVQEHYRRLKDFDGVPAAEFETRLKRPVAGRRSN